MNNDFRRISAVILAAGESRRMGQPKMLLPWGKTTVLGQVMATFLAAGVGEMVVVTGGARLQVEGVAKEASIRTVFNPDFALGGMLRSIQVGLSALPSGMEAALIALGDQPQVQASIVRRICAAFIETGAPLIVPSFRNRRGHPWLVGHSLWPEVMALPLEATPRHFLRAHATEIIHLACENDSILQDIDTLEEYRQRKP